MSRSGQQALLAQQRLELMHDGKERHNVYGGHSSLNEKASQPYVIEICVHREQPHSNWDWMIADAVTPPAAEQGVGRTEIHRRVSCAIHCATTNILIPF